MFFGQQIVRNGEIKQVLVDVFAVRFHILKEPVYGAVRSFGEVGLCIVCRYGRYDDAV